jgi:hypothetical protein
MAGENRKQASRDAGECVDDEDGPLPGVVGAEGAVERDSGGGCAGEFVVGLEARHADAPIEFAKGFATYNISPGFFIAL